MSARVTALERTRDAHRRVVGKTLVEVGGRVALDLEVSAPLAYTRDEVAAYVTHTERERTHHEWTSR